MLRGVVGATTWRVLHVKRMAGPKRGPPRRYDPLLPCGADLNAGAVTCDEHGPASRDAVVVKRGSANRSRQPQRQPQVDDFGRPLRRSMGMPGSSIHSVPRAEHAGASAARTDAEP
ncbi:hypothetical protein KH5H1_68170 [Corallococcus caeni]|nr:hypothetical protein KH5H1_68170 [Corallococcus sp. KH5-1]